MHIKQKNNIPFLSMKTSFQENSHVSCLFCSSPLVRIDQTVFDTRFGINENYMIALCENCNLEQTVSLPSKLELKNLYEVYYNFGGEKDSPYTKVREWLLSSWLYRIWLFIDGDISFHRQNGFGRLLDVGCNEGRGLKIYRKNGYDPEGLELNEKAASVARSQGLTVHSELLEEFQPTLPYDVVTLSNVLEHSLDPGGMLAQVQRILRAGGQIWISCPNNQSWLRLLFGRYWINWHVPFHIVHFSPVILRSLLESSGFKDIQIRQETPALWVAHSIIAWLFAKPGKPTGQLRSPLLVTFLMLIIRGFLFPFLWFGNRLGRGDCLVTMARRD